MRLRDLLEHEARPLLVRTSSEELLQGALRVEDAGEGWVRPWRFSADQLRAFGSCQAWHPGLFRQMARACAGIRLEFDTDSSEIALELRLDPEPRGTRAVLADVDAYQGSFGPHDGLSADVDGRHLAARMPREGDDYLTFFLDNPDSLPAAGLQRIPGIGGEEHHVRIWLPALRGCVVRDVLGNGSFISVCAARPCLLVLGDSIAQGFCTDDPALSWPAVLADRLELSLLNQGLGGQVFQPGSLLGLGSMIAPERIVVELGENYRYEACRDRLVSHDIRSYLIELARLWPQVPTWVLTPFYHDEQLSPSHRLSCFDQVPSFLAAHVAPHDEMQLVDGATLMDADSSLLADGYEHPTAKGAQQIAERLGQLIA